MGPLIDIHARKSLDFMLQYVVIFMLAITFVGCGRTYVDDARNFERALGYKRPRDVQMLHSIYCQTPHFTDEHCYYLELLPATNSSFLQALTNAAGIAVFTNPTTVISPRLGLDRPKWFAPKPEGSYELWASTNFFTPFAILRDRQDGKVFIYGSFGM
jgi:hypothetical protein